MLFKLVKRSETSLSELNVVNMKTTSFCATACKNNLTLFRYKAAVNVSEDKNTLALEKRVKYIQIFTYAANHGKLI